MDAHSRRELALNAITAVLAGADARREETEIVDFKEEQGTVDDTGVRMPIPPRHEPAARALAREVACLAMSDNGGVLVVGVDDKAAGRAAFVGSYLDLEWLRGRIYALTQPNLAVDVLEEHTSTGARLYLINIGPALAEVRVDGKLRTRMGTDCVELTGDRARAFLERWRRYDWSAESSELRLSGADPAAVARARDLYREARGRSPGSDLDLIRRLNVALDDSDDPLLSRAGALLLADFDPAVAQLDVRVTSVEGAPAAVREILRAPLVTTFDIAWGIVDSAFPATSIVVAPQRRSVRPIPEEALREALVNAIMHRDYRMPRAAVITLCIGDPPDTLKVISPGGFPDGVQSHRLLASRSASRNPALAEAMRSLGYAEREGVGIPTMYRALLRDGHAPPEIYPEGGDVVCRLPGGLVDNAVRAFFDGLYAFASELRDDVRAHVAVTALLSTTPLRIERLADLAQCSEGEAWDTLRALSSAGAVERLLDGSRSFRLTTEARHALQNRVSYQQRQSLDESWDLVRAFLDDNESIGRSEAAPLLGVGEAQATKILSRLFNDKRYIEPIDGRTKGRGVSYKLTKDS